MTQPNPVEMMREALEDQIRATAHAMGVRPDIIAMRPMDLLASQYASPSARAALAEMERWEQVALGMNAYQSESDCVHPRWVLDHDGYANREPMPAILLVRKP